MWFLSSRRLLWVPDWGSITSFPLITVSHNPKWFTMHHRSEGYILRDLLPAERCATWDPNGPFDQSCLCICDPMAPFKTLARTPTRMMIEWLRRLGKFRPYFVTTKKAFFPGTHSSTGCLYLSVPVPITISIALRMKIRWMNACDNRNHNQDSKSPCLRQYPRRDGGVRQFYRDYEWGVRGPAVFFLGPPVLSCVDNNLMISLIYWKEAKRGQPYWIITKYKHHFKFGL